MAKTRTTKHPMPAQPAQQRIKNFDEVPYGYSTDVAVEEAQRCLQCKNPKCVQGCPVGIDIPGFILKLRDQVFQGRSEEHTSELQSRPHLVCRLLLEKKKKKT